MMAEPTSTIALFSLAKAWSILAGVCGSLVPLLVFSDKRKVSLKQAVFMAMTGCSFSIFMGPWLAVYFNFTSQDAVVALSWVLGVVGVYLIRACLQWIENRGEQLFDNVFGKVTGTGGTQGRTDGKGYQTEPLLPTDDSVELVRRIPLPDGSGYFLDRRVNPDSPDFPNNRRITNLPTVTMSPTNMNEDKPGDQQ